MHSLWPCLERVSDLLHSSASTKATSRMANVKNRFDLATHVGERFAPGNHLHYSFDRFHSDASIAVEQRKNLGQFVRAYSSALLFTCICSAVGLSFMPRMVPVHALDHQDTRNFLVVNVPPIDRSPAGASASHPDPTADLLSAVRCHVVFVRVQLLTCEQTPKCE